MMPTDDDTKFQLSSRDPEVARKLRGLPEVEVEEGRAWRRAIFYWISAVCVSAIVCFWLVKPPTALQYQAVQVKRGSVEILYRFDRRTGEFEKINYSAPR